MTQRALVPAVLALLCAAACSSDPRDDTPDVIEGGALGPDAPDVVPADTNVPGEGGDASDTAVPNADPAVEGGNDSRDGSLDAGDGDSGRRDGDAGGNDGDAGGNDSDADGTTDGDAADSTVRDGTDEIVDDAGPPVCDWTHERIAVTVTLAGSGDIHDCTHLPHEAGVWPRIHGLLSGVVRDSSVDAGTGVSVVLIGAFAFTPSVCSDGGTASGCGPTNTMIRVATPTPFALPAGAFVEAEYWITQAPFACTQLLRISNLPEWNGQPNPVSDVAKTYVVASDGIANPSADIASTGITVTPSRLGCVTDAGPGCITMPAAVDSYAFQFSAAGSAPLVVGMGQSRSWRVNGQEMVARNLRSYESGFCDDYWNWAFTLVGQ